MPPQLPAPANRRLDFAKLRVFLRRQIRRGSLLRRGVTKLKQDPLVARFNLAFNPSAVLFRSSQSSVSRSRSMKVLSKVLTFTAFNRGSRSISVEISSKVLVNPMFSVFDCSSWSRSSESLSAMKQKQFRGAVAEIDPLPPPPQPNFAVKKHLRSKLPRRIRTHFSPILRSLFIERSALVTSEASSARVKSKESVVERKDVQMELSECSCVESSSGVFRGDSELKLKFKLKKSGNANVIEDLEAVVRSEISSIERFSFDLECLENLSTNNEVFNDYSSAYSELQSDILQESFDLDFSEYSPSLWYDPGSQFSEKSFSDDCPSHSFHLSRQFSEEFFRSTYALEHSPFLEEHNIPDEISLELEERGWRVLPDAKKQREKL